MNEFENFESLTEKTLTENRVFDGIVVKLNVDDVLLPNGEKTKRERIIHPGGVGIIALTDENEVLLVKQYRYGVQRLLIEIPAGKLEFGEDPLECGRRELLEETGYLAEEFTYLGGFCPTPAYCGEITHIFMARELTFKKQQLDKDEFLEVMKMPLNKAVELALQNKLDDGKTQIAVLKAKMLLENEQK